MRSTTLDPQLLLSLSLLALLIVFVLYPLAQVLYIAFWGPDGLTLAHFVAFFQRPLFREALANTLLCGAAAVVGGSLLGLPLAYFSVRYVFPGKSLLQILGVLPLVIPPFVGAVVLQLLLRRTRSVNLLLLQYLGVTVPFKEGLMGVMLVQTLHYFPFIMLIRRPRWRVWIPALRRQPKIWAAMGCDSSAASPGRSSCRAMWADVHPSDR